MIHISIAAMRAKPAEQARSKEKRDLLLQVTESLLRVKPFNQISVAEVAATANVSVATVYQRFNNKHAMGSILLELYYQRSRQWWEKSNEFQQPLKLYDALQQIGAKSWEQLKALQHIMRPAYLFSREHPELVGAEWQAMEQLAAQGFVQFLQNYQEELNLTDIQKYASTLCYFYNFMVVGKLLHADDTHWTIIKNKKTFTTELADFAYRYLKGQSQEQTQGR